MKTLIILIMGCLFATFSASAEESIRPNSSNYINGVTALNEGNPEKAY